MSSSCSQVLTAKSHAMYGRRLTEANYRELMRKQTVSEAAAYLKQQTYYSSLLHDINENLVHRGELEKLLRRDLFEQYLKFFHYLDKKQLRFYSFLIVKMEIDEILSCIRLLKADRISDYILTLPDFFAKYASFDLYALAKINDFNDLLRLLKPTRYYEVLSKYNFDTDDKIDLVKIEIELNKLYYDDVLDIIKHSFSGKVRQQLIDSFGINIDLANITNIIRLKKYYNENSSYINTVLLPYYFKITREEIESIMQAPDADAAWNVACRTYYGKWFKKYDYKYVENYAQQVLYSYHKHLMVYSGSAPLTVVAFIQLKETEIKNIFHIIEGIRYDLTPTEIGKLLVGVE